MNAAEAPIARARGWDEDAGRSRRSVIELMCLLIVSGPATLERLRMSRMAIAESPAPLHQCLPLMFQAVSDHIGFFFKMSGAFPGAGMTDSLGIGIGAEVDMA